MKKIFSSLLLIFLLPIKQIKKIKKNNFLLGLIFGALFSLVVNIISMQIQGRVDKQRVLEAIENEIMLNMIKAGGEVSTANRQQDLNFNAFIRVRKYSRDLWEQSIEPSQYVAQLNSDQQTKIILYYSTIIPNNNLMIDAINELYLKSMSDCFDYETKILPDSEQKTCNDKYHAYLYNNALYVADEMHKQSLELLKIFHPTQDRLNSPILRFLMGSESTKILSGQ